MNQVLTARLEGSLRTGLRRAKTYLKSKRVVRNLLSDIDNQDEFGHLYEHERMLADARRVDTYREGIARNIRPGDVVLDLGTGTGILAFLAARHGAARVYAIDHSPFIGVAERVARHNRIDNVVFVRMNSRAYTPPEPVDVVLHEQIGDELFDENMVENLLDLRRRGVLRPGGRILPARFELFIEPVTVKPAYRVPYVWERQIHGIDFSFLRSSGELARYMLPEHHLPYLRSGGLEHFLAEPEPLLSVDLDRIGSGDEIQRQFEMARVVQRPGVLDGFCMYFRAHFDDTVCFDTSPALPPTSWGNRLFRVEQRRCAAGEVLRYSVAIKDLVYAHTWEVRLEAR
ncbi:MAG TPA: 50S ribosomal protein L11 methyltransferase [Burkholderiales bacterium]|nr:50S ribosomal protein L11 methyltransferase [Burkholderiales bacterium]